MRPSIEPFPAGGGLTMSAKARGQGFAISAADIRALDLIGWDFDPAVGEPPSVELLVFTLLIRNQ